MPVDTIGRNLSYGKTDAGRRLALLLRQVGAPEGWDLTDKEIVDTGSALQIVPEEYEGRAVVYVHAGAPDPEHDPTPTMSFVRSLAGFSLYRQRNRRVNAWVAKGTSLWIATYVEPYSSTNGAVAPEVVDATDAWFESLTSRAS